MSCHFGYFFGLALFTLIFIGTGRGKASVSWSGLGGLLVGVSGT